VNTPTVAPAQGRPAARARRAAGAPAVAARKGQATRAAIIEAALAVARRDGLEGLTIGVLAERLKMSKSGVFAHFGSREELQLAVLKEYAVRFVDIVLRPAVARPRGLPRLRALLENWLALLAREIAAGCILIGGASEYDDRPGPMHDALVAIVEGWKGELLRAIEQAQQFGHLAAGADARQLVFEIYGLMLMAHQDARLLHTRDGVQRARAGLARLIEAARPRAAPRARARPAH
jgi:AcrR family transcriptional regulator